MDEMNVPKHVAIILDGNGRWAKKRGLPRNMGHAEGCKVVEQTVYDAAEVGIEYLTVYGFSTENWKRSADEVNALMKLLGYYTKRLLKVAKKNNVQVRLIGDDSRFSPDLQKSIHTLIDETKNNTGMVFVLALNYGGRDEIRRAFSRMIDDYDKQRIKKEDIDETMISQYLDTANIPDPDLIIRTSGEIRLSNYLIWQCAYSELYFTDVLWPDFNMQELKKAIIYYNQKDRRFGNAK